MTREPPRPRSTRWLASSHLKVTPGQIGLLRRHEFSSDLEERLKSVISQILRQGVVASKAELLENHDRGIMLRDLARSQEVLQLDLYRYLGYPLEVREVIEAETRRWLDFDRRERAALPGPAARQRLAQPARQPQRDARSAARRRPRRPPTSSSASAPGR